MRETPILESDFRDAWSSAEYPPGAIVSHQGSAWRATAPISSGEEPGVSADWRLLVEKGDTGDSIGADFEEYELVVTNERTGTELARMNLRGARGESITAAFDGDELVVRRVSDDEELDRRDLRGAKGDDGDSITAEFDHYELVVKNGRTGVEITRTNVRGEKGDTGDSITAAFDNYELVILQGTNEVARANLRGAPGLDGEDGADGDDGLSAFEVWKVETNQPDATVGEYLASLVGEPGEDGIDGTDGRSINFISSLASSADLPASPPAQQNDAYLIDGELWVYGANGWVNGGSIGLSDADIIALVKANDGDGSGLDADLLDGQHGSHYATAESVSDLSGEVDGKQPAGDYVEEGDSRLTDSRDPKPHETMHDTRYQRLGLLDTPGHPTTTDPQTGKHRLDDMPDELLGKMDRQGLWNAQTNTPNLGSMSKREGWYWIVSVEGTTNYGGKSDWKPKDWIVWSGSDFEWVDNTDSVTTVFGRVGNIEPQTGDYTAEQILLSQAISGMSAENVQAALAELLAKLNSTPTWRSGDMKMSAASAVENGWLACDGAAVSRTTYAALFSAIGTAYGAGNGSSTFNLPDLRGRVPVGEGASSGLTTRSRGQSGGSEAHALTVGQMPSHTHRLSGVPTSNTTQTAGGARITQLDDPYNPSRDSPGQGRTEGTGDGQAHPNMPPFGVVKYVIKT